MKIRAAVVESPNRPMLHKELQLVDPGPSEVIVEISHVGVCHTDIGVQATQALPAVLGHEGIGTVVECGSEVQDLRCGDRVVLTYGSCGTCRNCAHDLPSHCFNIPSLNFSGLSTDGKPTLSDADGVAVHGSFFYQSSFASHALANERNAIRVADDIAPELLAPLGCGVQTGVGAVVNTLNINPGASFTCFGIGSVGLSAIMAAKMLNCAPIIAIDKNSRRLELAQQLGATHALLSDADSVRNVLEISHGGTDFSFETAGVVETFHAAIECVRMGGHVGLAAVPNWVEGFHFQPASLALGRTVTGVLEGSSRPQSFIPQLCDWIRGGHLPVDKIVAVYPFEEINRAVDDLRSGAVVKPVLKL